MSKFSSENALIDRLFLKNLPDAIVYDSEFVGMTDNFLHFTRDSIRNFLTYLSENSTDSEKNYVLKILVYPKIQFKKKKWQEMMSVYDGLSCCVAVDCSEKEHVCISFVFSKNINSYVFNFITYSEYERFGR